MEYTLGLVGPWQNVAELEYLSNSFCWAALCPWALAFWWQGTTLWLQRRPTLLVSIPTQSKFKGQSWGRGQNNWYTTVLLPRPTHTGTGLLLFCTDCWVLILYSKTTICSQNSIKYHSISIVTGRQATFTQDCWVVTNGKHSSQLSWWASLHVSVSQNTLQYSFLLEYCTTGLIHTCTLVRMQALKMAADLRHCSLYM